MSAGQPAVGTSFAEAERVAIDEWQRKLASFKNGTPTGVPTVFVSPSAKHSLLVSSEACTQPVAAAPANPISAAAMIPETKSVPWKMNAQGAPAVQPVLAPVVVPRASGAPMAAAAGAASPAATDLKTGDPVTLRPGQRILDLDEIKKLEDASAQKITDRYKLVNAAFKLVFEYQKHNNQNRAGPDAVRLLDPTEKQLVGDAIMNIADHNPAMAIQLGRLTYTLIDLDHRSHHELFYTGCAHMHNGTIVDAICNWCASIKAESPPSQPKPGKIQRRKTVVDGKLVTIETIKNYDKSDDFRFRHIRQTIHNTANPLVHQIGQTLKPNLGNVAPMEKLFTVKYTGEWKTPRGLPQHYHIFNPCLRRHPTQPGKFLINLRAANYFMERENRTDGSHGYNYVDHKGARGQPFRTLNYLTTIDEDSNQETFRAVNVKLMIVPQVPYPHHIGGYEDVRLLWNDQDKTMWITFTSLELSPQHTIRICAAKLDVDTAKVVPGTTVILPSFDAGRAEKNWMGFFYQGHLCLVYELFPVLTVLKANLEFVNNKPGPKYGETTVVSIDQVLKPNVYRGSSPLMDVPKVVQENPLNARLFVDHQPDDRYYMAVVHVSDYPRYCNALAMFRLRPSPHSMMRPFACYLMAATPLFFFRELDVEFTCGMEFTSDGKDICIPNASKDQFCFFTRLEAQSVMNQLQKIDDVAQLDLRKQLHLF